jgi:hypothetical protein
MAATLRQAGFSLEELAALPPRAWADLYGAVTSLRFEWFATLMAALHPKSPSRGQRQFMRASRAAMATGERPIWQDPQRFKKMLMGVAGVVVEDQAKQEATGPPPPRDTDSGPAAVEPSQTTEKS